MSRLYLGIDGGGSKTHAVLCEVPDSTTVNTVWEMQGPPANWLGAGDSDERVVATLREVCARARDRAGDSVHRATAGLAGAVLRGRRGRAEGALRSFFARADCRVMSDAEAAHWAAGLPLTGRTTVISGTGSVAVARSGAGWLSAGGHGGILADEGSSFTIGREGLRAAVRHEEGRDDAPLLLERALSHYRVRRAADLVCVVHQPWGLDVSAVAGFSREVFAAAQSGESVAEQILRRAAEDLASLVLSLRRRGGEVTDAVHIVGGSWRGRPSLARWFCAVLWSECADIGIASPLLTPAEGAALCAAMCKGSETGGGT